METPEPDLPVTPRREKPGGNNAVSSFTVAQRWLAEHQVKVLCIAVAILSPLVSLWFVKDAITKAKEATWVYQVDATGAITWAPASIADPSSGLYREVVMQAAEAYLKRNPEGLSNPEIAQRFFRGNVWAAVQRDLNAQSQDRKRRNLYDQAEFSRLPERLDENATALRYRVVGYIIRSGVIDGLPQRDVGEFRMGIELAPQSELRMKGTFPFEVAQYRGTITWRSDGRVEEFASIQTRPADKGGQK